MTDISGRLVNDGGSSILGVVIENAAGYVTAFQCPSFGRTSPHWTGRQVLDAGQTLSCICEGTPGDPGLTGLSVTGYDLQAP